MKKVSESVRPATSGVAAMLFIEQLWEDLSAFAWSQYQIGGRGAVLVPWADVSGSSTDAPCFGYVTSAGPDCDQAIAAYEPTRDVVFLFLVDGYEKVTAAIRAGRMASAFGGRSFCLTVSRAPGPASPDGRVVAYVHPKGREGKPPA